MSAWHRALRWLMLALACAALGASAVPARAQGPVDAVAQVEQLARQARKAGQVRAVRSLGDPARLPRALPAAPRRAGLRLARASRLPAPPGRLYLSHRSLLR